MTAGTGWVATALSSSVPWVGTAGVTFGEITDAGGREITLMILRWTLRPNR